MAHQEIASNQDFFVEVARSVEEVERLRPVWQRLECPPDPDLDAYLIHMGARQEVLRPHVIVLGRGGIPESILIGWLEEQTFDFKFGYKAIHGPRVRCLAFLYRGLIGCDSEPHTTAMVKSVLASLKNGEADLAVFNHARVDSNLYQAARQTSPYFSRGIHPVFNRHWASRLPSSKDELWARRSKRTRDRLRLQFKRLEREFGDDLLIKRFAEKSEIDQVIADIEKISAQTYHRALGAGFIANEETRRLVRLACDRRWFRAYILYINEIPCAFWTGYLRSRTFFIGATGYVPAHRKYGLGSYLFSKMLEDLCAEHVAERVDFGLGDAEYKSHWGDECWQEASLHLFAPTLKCILLNVLSFPLVAATRLAEKFPGYPSVKQKIKNRWRKRLAKDQTDMS